MNQGFGHIKPLSIEVDPVEDVRVKASLRRSDKIAVFNGEAAEELIDMSLEECKDIDEEDREPVVYGKVEGKDERKRVRREYSRRRVRSELNSKSSFLG